MSGKRNKKRRGRGDAGSVARSRGKTLRTYRVGGLPVLNHFLGRLRLDRLLGEAMRQDKRCKISPATGVLVLVRNYLISRSPLYGVSEWARGFPPELLDLTEDQLESLNDDRLGRCLDRLFDADCPALVLRVTHHVIREFGVDLQELHNDSTTVTFFGEYRGASEERRHRGKKVPAVTYGHNKDHRPDLKQLLYHLTVSADGTVPVAFGVESGNVTDDQTHRDTWELLCTIKGDADFLYVADSKLASRENMSYIANRGGRFISVLPRSRAEDQQFRDRVIKKEVVWSEVYRKVDERGRLRDVISSTNEATLTAEGYRLVWFHSTRKAELDQAARAAAVQRADASLTALYGKLLSPRTRYRDEARVHEEIERRLAQHGAKEWFDYQIVVQENENFVQQGRGRPGPNTPFRREVKRFFRLIFQLNPDKLAEAALHDGVFPLVTNERRMSDMEILHAYKRQANIEKRFSQLKSQFQLTPVFLKSPHRLVALLTVYYFALLLQALIERELREGMKVDRWDTLPIYPEARRCKAPTTRRVLDMFDNIDRHELASPTAKQPTLFATELSEDQKLVLKLLGVPVAHYEL